MLKNNLKGKNSKLIRGALNKTQFREQSESLFLTSGYLYQSAEQAEAIFKGDETGFQYTRYANPTIDTFEKRMAIIDGSESCFATASGMAAVFASLMCQLQTGDHVISATALFGSCREVIKNVITRYGIEISFIDGKKIGLKTDFLSLQFGNERIFNENFIQEFKNLAINQDKNILILCRSGARSQFAAELLNKENYTCINISDGFEGNQENIGWIRSGLPC